MVTQVSKFHCCNIIKIHMSGKCTDACFLAMPLKYIHRFIDLMNHKVDLKVVRKESSNQNEMK